MLCNVDRAPSICGWPITRTRRSILLILLTELPTLFRCPKSVNCRPIVSCKERRLHLLALPSIHDISHKITDFLIKNSSHFIVFRFLPLELPLQWLKTQIENYDADHISITMHQTNIDRFYEVHVGENIWSIRYRKLQSCSGPFTSFLTINILHQT